MFLKVLLRRLLTFLPTILGIATFAFILGHATPGDPAYAALGIDLEGYSGVDLEEVERVRIELGLDKPILVQYVNWIWNALQGDFGRSYVNDYVVMDAVIEALPNTLYLLGCTMIVAIIIGVSIGMISAIFQGTIGDLIARMISIIGVSTPVFWFALILILVFAYTLDWFPIGGDVEEFGLKALVLPVASIALHPAALIARMTRSSMLEVLSHDMIRTATSKGLFRKRIFFIHALRNAINPVVTVIGFQTGNLVGGAVAIEMIFTLRGMGELLISAIYDKDILTMQCAILVIGVSFAIINLLVDMIYLLIDPRIKL